MTAQKGSRQNIGKGKGGTGTAQEGKGGTPAPKKMRIRGTTSSSQNLADISIDRKRGLFFGTREEEGGKEWKYGGKGKRGRRGRVGQTYHKFPEPATGRGKGSTQHLIKSAPKEGLK